MKVALEPIIRVLGEGHSLDVTPYDETFLIKSIEKRLAATGCPTMAAYVKKLSEDKTEARAFHDSLHITYSEFFRNPLTFAVLEQIVLPGLVESKKKAGRKEIRIWSAACAAGQEAYSLAILLDDLAALRGPEVSFRIFATDMDATGLAAAREGLYDDAAVQRVPLKHIRNAFAKKGERFMIHSRFQRFVDFSYYDLLAKENSCPPVSIYGDFDLVFCSNLLFYYRPDVRKHILGKMRGCLSNTGYFVSGEVERGIVDKNMNLREVAPPSAVFQQIKQRGDR